MRISNRSRRIRVPAACVLSALLFVTAIPLGAAVAEPDRPENRVEITLEHLSDILGRLESELSALEAPAAERLEEGLERAIELIGDLLDGFGQSPDGEEEGAAARARIVRIDLMLHRLLHVLDGIVEDASKTPARLRAKDALDGLRDWVDGYIAGATSEMGPREAARFERAAHEMIRSLAQRLVDVARRAAPSDGDRASLGRLVDRLEGLLFRLDGLILHHPAEPPSRE